MAGLIAFGIIGLYLALCIFVIRAFARRTSTQWVRWVIYGLGFPLLIAAPLADEIIGKFQFDRLCKAAEAIQVYGSIPVGEELYTPDGKWRRSHTGPLLSLEDSNKVSQQINNLLRYEHNEISGIPAAIPISGSENRIFSRSTGQLLAIYRIYGTQGGWLSRKLEKPLVVRDQCLPKEHLEIERRILPFNKTSNENNRRTR